MHCGNKHQSVSYLRFPARYLNIPQGCLPLCRFLWCYRYNTASCHPQHSFLYTSEQKCVTLYTLTICINYHHHIQVNHYILKYTKNCKCNRQNEVEENQVPGITMHPLSLGDILYVIIQNCVVGITGSELSDSLQKVWADMFIYCSCKSLWPCCPPEVKG